MKSDRIRRLLAKGLSAVEIAKRLKVKASYVHTVKWLDKKANAKKKAQVERSHDPKVKKAEKKYLKAVKTKKPSKIIKAVKEMKQALDVIEIKKDPKAEAWLKNNAWFGVDEKKTAYALGLHEELVRSGVDAKSDEYYQKIDEGMKVFGKPKITRKQLLKELMPGLDACFGLDKPVDMVNKPPHYTDGGVDTLSFIEAKDLNYRLGNVVKYVSRAGKKMGSNPVQDLEKARFYLEREIAARKSA
jgi:Protein of unknwon function (DUF3310)